MKSLELIINYLSTLDNWTLDKVETKELLNLLHEIQKIPQLIERIQSELKKRVETEAVSGYIELDDKLYSLEENTFYSAVTVDQANSMELIELSKEIADSANNLDEYIDSETQRIDDLCIKKYNLIKTLVSEAKTQKVIKDNIVLVNKENNLYQTFKEN